MQLITEIMKLIKNLLKLKYLKVTRAMVETAKLTLNVLNFLNF